MIYVYRWDRHGRKGQPCLVTARSKSRLGDGPALAFGAPRRKNFNSILVEFGDGYGMVTSGNAIRKHRP